MSLDRAVYRANICGASGPQAAIFLQEAFQSSNLPQTPANDWTQTHKHVNTNGNNNQQ